MIGMANHAALCPAIVRARDRLMAEWTRLIIESSRSNPIQDELNLILRQRA